jgi:hypothetical protein
MTKQIHKQFSNEEVKEALEKYEEKTFSFDECMRYLRIKRSRLFLLLKKYREDPDGFSIEFKRDKPPRGIGPKVEKRIIGELEKEAVLIADKRNTVNNFNYSYVKNILEAKHKITVSLPTIISLAKKTGFIRESVQARPMTAKS